MNINKKKIVISMVIGYLLFTLGFLRLSILGIICIFIGGVFFEFSLLSIGLIVRNKNKWLSILIVAISIFTTIVVVIACIIMLNILFCRRGITWV